MQSLFDNGSVTSVCIGAQRYHYCYTLGLSRNDTVGMSATVWVLFFILKNANTETVSFWHTLSTITAGAFPTPDVCVTVITD